MPYRKQFPLATIQKIIPFFIILLAFFFQMRYLAELGDTFPDGFGKQPFCGIDAEAHDHRASGLLDGSIPGPEPFYFIPLYPLYLAAFKILWGNSLLLPIFIQALLQLVGIAALYSIGRLVFSPLAGMLAALGMASYNYYIYYLPCFDQSLITIPFLTLTIFFILNYHHSQKPWNLLGAGLALALAAISRPTILVVLPVIIIWLYFTKPTDETNKRKFGPINYSPQRLRTLGRDIILLTVPFLIAVAPITWHNYRTSGRFILISDNFGVNFFTGNNPDAAGLDSLAHVQGQPAELRFREVIKRANRGETTLTTEAFNYITEQPADWLALMATKTWLWLGESDERLVTPVFPLTVRQSQTLAPLPLEWQALAIAALMGILLVRGRSRQHTIFLWLVYGTLSAATILFFIQLRFRLPLMPFVILLAASLIASAHQWRYQQPRRFLLTLIVLLLLYPLVPTLWIFILLFAGIGLLPHRLTRHSRENRKQALILLAIGVYLLLIGWWVKAETLASDVSQTIDHYLGPPLAANGILGQTFQMDCDNLNQIEITLGILNPQHDQPVIFSLATNTSAQDILFSETFSAKSIDDYQKMSFSFPPISDSAGHTFFLFLNSPTSTPQNAITVRGYSDTPIDRYPAGQALAGDLNGLQKIEADFSFTASCQMSWQEKLKLAIREFFGETEAQ